MALPPMLRRGSWFAGSSMPATAPVPMALLSLAQPVALLPLAMALVRWALSFLPLACALVPLALAWVPNAMASPAVAWAALPWAMPLGALTTESLPMTMPSTAVEDDRVPITIEFSTEGPLAWRLVYESRPMTMEFSSRLTTWVPMAMPLSSRASDSELPMVVEFLPSPLMLCPITTAESPSAPTIWPMAIEFGFLVVAWGPIAIEPM